jgi:hypothetical protein
LRDAVELEWAGIPSLPIIHHSVRGSAESMAKLSGVPDYPFLIVDYPYIPTALWSDDEVARLADEITDGVIGMLTRGI